MYHFRKRLEKQEFSNKHITEHKIQIERSVFSSFTKIKF